MGFGITPQGFTAKRLDQIKAEIENSLRQGLGNGINLLPTGLLGQIVGIMAEQFSQIWELSNATYDSFFPDNAQGVNLDNVVAITGIKRLEATKATGTGIAYGTSGTILPVGLIFSVLNEPERRFLSSEEVVIGAGTNEVQTIQFSSEPDAGQWSLVYDGNETSTLNYNDNAAAIQAAINAVGGLSGVTVSGNYTTGFTITFAGADGEQAHPLLVLGQNTLTDTSVAVGVSIVETTAGVLPNVTVPLVAETAGAGIAYANTLTVIESPISGLEEFTNPNDIDNGKDIETDAELRVRRFKTLANPGISTLDSIRARLLAIDEVTDARVFENDTDVTDGFGRPPHSIEAVVLGGDEQEIADTIWLSKAAGIATHGDVSETVQDSMGFFHTVRFSRPAPISIYILVDNLVTNSDFPLDGMEAIKEALANYGDQMFSIGDDVIFNKLHCPISDIAGVEDYDLFIATTPAPASTANITIADDEVSFFDTANITVQT